MRLVGRRNPANASPSPPPGTQFVPPGELVEGYTRSVDNNPFSRLLGRRDPAFAPPERLELDLDDPSDFDAQLFDQVG